jgi:hypothetical protein
MALSGCSMLRAPASGPDFGAGVLSLDSLAAVVNGRAAALGSLKGSGDLVVESPGLGRPRTLAVSLVAKYPDQARVRGRVGALVSVFDFLADGDSLRLYLPRDRALLVESAAGSDLPLLGSGELVQALLQPQVDVARVRRGDGFRPYPEGYEVTVVDPDSSGGRLTRRLLYEPRRLRLTRQVLDREAPGGLRRAVITYSGHRWTGALWFPGTARLELPGRGESLELRFLSFEVNAVIKPEAFVMPVPAHARRIRPEELSEDYLNNAPEASR